MLAANPESALAHVIRYRYRGEFGMAADKNDIARALELGPDDAAVLIAAATQAEQSHDLAGARKYAGRGLERYPADPTFPRLAAAMELSDSHPERAEVILRRGVAAIPGSVELKIALVECLISQGKIEGEDGANTWIENLRMLGLVDGYIRYLEAQLAMVQRKWPQAISRFDSAQALLAADSVVVARINLMLADCYGHVPGGRELRIATLQRAASGETNAPLVRPRLAQAMEEEGRLDEATRLHMELIATRPESRLDLVRLLTRTTMQKQPSLRSWQTVEQRLEEAEKALPQASMELSMLRADLLAAKGQRDAEFFACTYQSDKAIPILEHFVDPMFKPADPFRAWARRTLAGCLMSSRSPADQTRALELLEINRSESPESIEDLRAQAILVAMDPGKCAEAIRLLSELEARRGLDPREETLLIQQLDRMGLWEQVEPRLQRLAAAETSDSHRAGPVRGPPDPAATHRGRRAVVRSSRETRAGGATDDRPQGASCPGAWRHECGAGDAQPLHRQRQGRNRYVDHRQ